MSHGFPVLYCPLSIKKRPISRPLATTEWLIDNECKALMGWMAPSVKTILKLLVLEVPYSRHAGWHARWVEMTFGLSELLDSFSFVACT